MASMALLLPLRLLLRLLLLPAVVVAPESLLPRSTQMA